MRTLFTPIKLAQLGTFSLGWLLILGLMAPSIHAMCISFWQPGRTFEPADNMRTFYSYEDDKSKLIVQPEFSGTASEFALIMPFPSQPKVEEVGEEFFDELEDLTNPEVFFDDAVLESEGGIRQSLDTAAPEVNVIKRETVGDFQSTLIEATDGGALYSWLEDQGYEITPDKREALDHYVNKDWTYFTALKVDVRVDTIDDNGRVDGALSPISFEYQVDEPELPFRLMATNDDSYVNMVVYTMGDDLWYIPGAEQQFARKLGVDDLAGTELNKQVSAKSKFLVRNGFGLNTSQITSDQQLHRTSEQIALEGGITASINPDKWDPESGIDYVNNGNIEYLRDYEVGAKKNTNVGDNGADNVEDNILVWAVVGLLGLSNLFLLSRVLGDKNNSPKSRQL